MYVYIIVYLSINNSWHYQGLNWYCYVVGFWYVSISLSIIIVASYSYTDSCRDVCVINKHRNAFENVWYTQCPVATCSVFAMTLEKIYVMDLHTNLVLERWRLLRSGSFVVKTVQLLHFEDTNVRQLL